MKNRVSLVTSAVVAVALWVAGLVLAAGVPSNLASHASDAEILAWVKDNKTPIILGSWLFMLGCVVFLVFAGLLRERLATAEGGNHLLANIAFGGAVAASVLGVGINADIGTAIDTGSVTPAAAAAFHSIGDLSFMGAELMMIPLVAAASLVALRTGVLPRWWAVLGLLVAVVLAIGPIGWAALVFGTPIWTLGTSLLVGRRPRRAGATAKAATA
jgi:hypothetical protein